MAKFNHAFDFAFEVISDREDASDVTSDMIVAALLQRVSVLISADEIEEACSAFDTYEIESTN